MLHAMNFDEIAAKDMVILGGPETVANAILRLVKQLDLMIPRIRHVLQREAAASPPHAA